MGLPSIYRNRRLRVGLFVDEVNIFRGCKFRFGFGPDYRKIRDLAVDGNILIRAIIYTVERGDPLKDSWINGLKLSGYDVRTKQLRRVSATREKANWDIGMCIDVVQMIDSLDIIVLASGDGDFEPLIRYCQSRGKAVRVISVYGSTAGAMKEAPDEYVEVSADELVPEAAVSIAAAGETRQAAEEVQQSEVTDAAGLLLVLKEKLEPVDVTPDERHIYL